MNDINHTVCARCKTAKSSSEGGWCEACKLNERERRAEIQSRGICIECKRVPAVVGMTLCQPCRERNTENVKAIYDKRKVAGVCIKCQGTLDAGSKSYCRSCLDIGAAATKRCNDKRKAEIIAEYGGKCAFCGQARPEMLTIDHINGDGSKHRKEMSAGGLHGWLRKNNYPKDNFRLLCYNCNMGRHINSEKPPKVRPPREK